MDKTFGGFVRQMLVEKDLRQRTVAAKAHISLSYFNDIAHDRRKPPMDPAQLDLMADALNLTKEEKNIFFDLAGKSRNTVSPDLIDYIMRDDLPALRKVIRIVRDEEEKDKFANTSEDESRDRFVNELGDGFWENEFWEKVIKLIEKEKENRKQVTVHVQWMEYIQNIEKKEKSQKKEINTFTSSFITF